MKKWMLTTCALLCLGPVRADELADAQLLWEKRDFARAFQSFSVLAKAGNSAAQLQLGEMYGFGEGTPEDAGQAAYWLNQAAAAGSPEAAASLALVRERGAHRTEIAYYVSNFDGAALSYAKQGCLRPVFPARSTTNAEIEAVNGVARAWRDCYGRFAAALNGALPATNTIPPALLKLMNNDEFKRAEQLIGATYTRIAADAQTIADQIGTENEAWKRATEEYVATNNQVLKAKLAADALIFGATERETQQGKEAWRTKNQASKKPMGK